MNEQNKRIHIILFENKSVILENDAIEMLSLCPRNNIHIAMAVII